MIRWIVDEQLGTAAYSTVCGSNYEVLDVRYLIDGAGNSREKIKALILRGVKILSSGKPLIVACDFGVSRSNAIAAGILSQWKRQPFEAALHTVLSQTREQSVKLSMIETVRSVVDSTDKQIEENGAILLTGGSGFLGRNLRNALMESGNKSVLSPSRQELDLLAGSPLLSKYIRDHNVSQIVHLAFPRIYTNISAMGESITMLRTVVDACTNLGISLFTLSGAVVFSGYKVDDLIAETDLTPNATHVYGETKLLEEAIIRRHIRNSGLRAAIIRLAPTYGPGGSRPRFIRQFHEAIQTGETINVHKYINGEARLELIYVDDATSGISEIITRKLYGTFHVGTDTSYSPLDVARTISELTKNTLNFNFSEIEDYVSNIRLGNRNDTEALCWRPKISLAEGLKRTLFI